MSQAEPGNRPSGAPDRCISLRVIRITGPDAEAFAQAQFTSDVAGIVGQSLHPSTWCAADGRARAVVLLGRIDAGMVLVLPDSLLGDTLAKLKMFSIGRDVQLDDGGPARPASGPDDAGAMTLSHDAARALIADTPDAAPSQLDRDWLLRDIDLRMPWLLPATSGRFLPQMLGMEHLGGLSYAKGCYPGQEVIARVHYRGRVTKRTARFEVQGDAVPEPGAELSVGDAAGTVLYAVRSPSGSPIRGLAVVPAETGETAPVGIGRADGRLVAE